jgi:hypothetical protein
MAIKISNMAIKINIMAIKIIFFHKNAFYENINICNFNIIKINLYNNKNIF